MNKNTKMIMLVGAVIALLGAGALWAGFSNNESTTNQVNQDQQSQVAEQNSQKQPASNVTISEDKKTVSYQGEEGKTALETLRQRTDVETKTESFGEFVTGINGLVADSAKEYWAFYVNGAYASEGAGTYIQKSGDVIEWKLEELSL